MEMVEFQFAVSRGHYETAEWLLKNGNPDSNWKNFQGKTSLDATQERKDGGMAELLRKYGSSEHVW